MLRRWTILAVLATTGGVVAAPKPLLFPFPPELSNEPKDSGVPGQSSLERQLFEDTLSALRVLQDEYFEPWAGTWPRAIDWTAAVMGSQVVGALQSLSKGLAIMRSHGVGNVKAGENLISLYFSHLVSFYFGQDYNSIRYQAFDDMLWVVLGWLDTLRFAREHSRQHYEKIGYSLEDEKPWYGTTWESAFAHRARVFWHLAFVGWDTELCGGGMNWNPRLEPYKNAITNELYIAASIAMYIDFPGDKNESPFATTLGLHQRGSAQAAEWKPHDPKYREAALRGYEWLLASNMTNEKGLFVDGFHISGYKSGSNNTKCDARDEMVYTYNQGVLLSGQRGLFEVTGNFKYLQEGHTLIHNVIRATGWDLARNGPMERLDTFLSGELPPEHGLGRAGVLEEQCDVRGTCSQDAQTFKGIWMHHFTSFCAPFGTARKYRLDAEAIAHTEAMHIFSCRQYRGWLQHNADAARATRDAGGKFGMWWTAGLLRNITTTNIHIGPDTLPHVDGAVDYRNEGVPDDATWVPHPHSARRDTRYGPRGNRQRNVDQIPLSTPNNDVDVNSRGRGRTVETQSGGLAVLRALWEVTHLPEVGPLRSHSFGP